jgi:hypothetical protein
MRTPEQRLSDADGGKWYAPIPFTQIHECGAKVNENAVKLALEDVLGELRKREKKEGCAA